MSTRIRQWTVYASGTIVFVLVGLGVPLLLLEHLRTVFAASPAGLG